MLTEHLLRIRDVSIKGKILYEFDLRFQQSDISIKEIIEARVRSEVNEPANGMEAAGFPLFQVDPTETLLNNEGVGLASQLDADKQVKRALHAFEVKSKSQPVVEPFLWLNCILTSPDCPQAIWKLDRH